jgi:integrase
VTRDEVRALLQHLDGVPRLLGLLFYGAGLRLREGARLRVQDVDFAANLIVVRDGKGAKDRVTMLPAAVKADLARHLEEGFATSTSAISRPAPAGSSCPTPSDGSTQAPAGNGLAVDLFPATRLYFQRETRHRRRHHLHGPSPSVR